MKQTVIVTRDETESFLSNCRVWPEGTELEKRNGEWEAILGCWIIEGSEFLIEELFGFTPRKGSKETITITVERKSE